MKTENQIRISYNNGVNEPSLKLKEKAPQFINNCMPSWVRNVMVYGRHEENIIGVRIFLPIIEFEDTYNLHSLSIINKTKGNVIALRLIDNVLCIDCEWEL